MKSTLTTIFDPNVRVTLINRIHQLSVEQKAQWGKMNVIQMIDHMITWNRWVIGKNDLPHKQGLLGWLIGRWMLRLDTKDDKPMSKGIPAGKGFVSTKSEGNIEELKRNWIALIEDYEDFPDEFFHHDFYGKMTMQQLGIFAYKHMDHHLRQFGS